MAYAIIFFYIFFVLLVIAVKFYGKVEKLSSKDKIPLLSIRAKSHTVMFCSLFASAMFLCSLYLYTKDPSLYRGYRFLHLYAMFPYIIYPFVIFCLYMLIGYIRSYFINGNINFYDDGIEIIPFLGKKKIYKYNKISVIFGTGIKGFSRGPGAWIVIINKENFSCLDRLRSCMVSEGFHENPGIDFLWQKKY